MSNYFAAIKDVVEPCISKASPLLVQPSAQILRLSWMSWGADNRFDTEAGLDAQLEGFEVEWENQLWNEGIKIMSLSSSGVDENKKTPQINRGVFHLSNTEFRTLTETPAPHA
ncbi:hypothetical protein [Pseudomonas sp. DTU12.3]|uniref:hypothetical protein n=1 Tax=Pseudomonas sp. DTU12.3 TaxID=2073078 RepID=UPI0010100A21|nr:hypothetical protein [Pseudomonas sp. DTU12.3]